MSLIRAATVIQTVGIVVGGIGFIGAVLENGCGKKKYLLLQKSRQFLLQKKRVFNFRLVLPENNKVNGHPSSGVFCST